MNGRLIVMQDRFWRERLSIATTWTNFLSSRSRDGLNVRQSLILAGANYCRYLWIWLYTTNFKLLLMILLMKPMLAVVLLKDEKWSALLIKMRSGQMRNIFTTFGQVSKFMKGFLFIEVCLVLGFFSNSLAVCLRLSTTTVLDKHTFDRIWPTRSKVIF